MMESSIVAVLLLIATLVLALGAFALYSVSFSDQYKDVSEQEYLIGISKLISIEVSQLTYAGMPPNYNYFNVSYMIWIQSPTKTVTVVTFVTSSQTNLPYILPSSSQNASLFTSRLNGYSSLHSFNLNATVYLPQGGQSLGDIHAVAYNVSSNSTYVLSAVLRPSQIIVLWLLYYYDGKWYRLDYVYLSPFSSGIGVYIISDSGIYKGYNGTSGNPTPCIFIIHGPYIMYKSLSCSLSNLTPCIYAPQTAFQIGMWFKVINVQQSRTPLLNVTFIPTKTPALLNVTFIPNVTILPTSNNIGKKFSVILYTQGSSVYVNVSGKVKLLYNNLKVGQPYFINFTSGFGKLYFINFTNYSQFYVSQDIKFTIYNKQGELLNSTVISLVSQGKLFNYSSVMNQLSQINGYTLLLTFGSKTISNGIYQAFVETTQNQLDTSPFWNVSNIAVHNGPLYNNTYLFNWTVAHNPNINALAYWYFVWPYNSPPPQMPGILWYRPSGTLNFPGIHPPLQLSYILPCWPFGTSSYPRIYYLPENGTNTYVLG
jgi:hypothetical protein